MTDAEAKKLCERLLQESPQWIIGLAQRGDIVDLATWALARLKEPGASPEPTGGSAHHAEAENSGRIGVGKLSLPPVGPKMDREGLARLLCKERRRDDCERPPLWPECRVCDFAAQNYRQADAIIEYLRSFAAPTTKGAPEDGE